MLFLIISIAKFYVAPASIEIFGSDITHNGEIEILNADENETLRIKSYSGSFYLNNYGDIIYPNKDTISNSCSKWIYLNPSEFSLPPKGKLTVRYTILIPEISEEYWGVIFFEAVNVPKVWTPIVIAPRIGVSVYVIPPTIQTIQADIVSIFFKDGFCYFTIRNEGNVKIRPNIKYHFKELGKETTITDSILGTVIFHGYERTYKINRILKKGSYYISVEVDYGGSEIIKGEKIFDIR